jgi:hypothetical protein
MHLDFQIDTSQWGEALAGAARRVGNMTPAHREIGRLLVDMSRQNIETGGGNEKWAPLALSTLINRARNPSGRAGRTPRKVFTKKGFFRAAADRAIMAARPLIWSGGLLRSMRFDAQRDYVDVGTPMVKGWGLFYSKRPKLPARYPYRFRVGDEERISDIYLKRIWGEK